MEESLWQTLLSSGLSILLILVVARLMHHFSMIAVKKFVKRTVKSDNFKTEKDREQRIDTLLSTSNALLRVIIWLVASLLIVSELGINIAPLLAGAGIAGVALGFGAQTIVKDYLSGFFILAENQYRVGDVVELNQIVSGVVELVTLRETVLRDLDGMVHHMPNGEITLATNMTMEYANVNLDIGVGYDTDIEKLEKVINDIGVKLANDPGWKDKIFEAPQFLRVDNFADSAIEVKITGKTAPMQQWAVTGELRKRLKIAFDKNGITIPFPQRVIHTEKKK